MDRKHTKHYGRESRKHYDIVNSCQLDQRFLYYQESYYHDCLTVYCLRTIANDIVLVESCLANVGSYLGKN